MMNLYGGQGMGAAGTGLGSGGGMSPQMMQMLQAMQGGTPTGGMQPAPGPMQATPAGTPMANMIGQMGGQMHGGSAMPMMPPAPIQGMGGDAGGGTAGGGMINPQMLQMMQMLKQGQTGVPSTVGSANPALSWNPNNPVGTSTLGGATANNGWLQNWLNSLRGTPG